MEKRKAVISLKQGEIEQKLLFTLVTDVELIIENCFPEVRNTFNGAETIIVTDNVSNYLFYTSNNTNNTTKAQEITTS